MPTLCFHTLHHSGGLLRHGVNIYDFVRNKPTLCRNRATICNTNYYFLRIWITFVKKFFDVDSENIVLHIGCYLNNYKTLDNIESYWLEQLDLPKSCLRKTTVVTQHKFSTGSKKNKHPYGVATVSVYSTEIVQKIWGAIKSYAGINDNNKWLD